MRDARGQISCCDRSRRFHAISTAMTMLFCASAARAGVYSVTGITVPGADFVAAVGINNLGQVVGYADLNHNASRKGIVWTPGVGITQLSGPPGSLDSTTAIAINNSGQVVGWGMDSDYELPALWTPNGASYSGIDLGDINQPGSFGISAAGINDAGVIIGSGLDWYHNGGRHGFLWKPTAPNGTAGAMVSLGGGGGIGDVAPSAINSAGAVVGFSNKTGPHYEPGLNQAFLWKPDSPNATTGSMHELEVLPPNATGQSSARSINDAGQVVGGWTLDDTNSQAFLWTPDEPGGTVGSSINLGFLPGVPNSSAQDINSAGTIVGSSGVNGGRAFVWTASDGMQDLNYMLDDSGAGWTLFRAVGINDSGWIIGSGQFDPDGPGGVAPIFQEFLLTPIPEPGLLAIAAFGALAIHRQRGARPPRMD